MLTERIRDEKAVLVSISLLITLRWVSYSSLTLFVVPSIGVIPEGKTVVELRLANTNFIDSPEAMCERLQGGVSLLSRGNEYGGCRQKIKDYS